MLKALTLAGAVSRGIGYRVGAAQGTIWASYCQHRQTILSTIFGQTGNGHAAAHNAITLRQLRHLRRFVTDDCFRTLVVSLVHSRLDYGNFVLVGLPVYL